MSIGKKLYAGFGLVLVILVGLFLVNSFAALRERTARSESAASLKGVQTIETVRLQIMLNRLNLDNFLLSGDPRDEEKVNKGITELTDTLKQGEAQAAADVLRTTLLQVESTEVRWTLAIPRFQICRFFTSRKIPLHGLPSLPFFSTKRRRKLPKRLTKPLNPQQRRALGAPVLQPAAHFWQSYSESVSRITPRNPSLSRFRT